MFIVFHSSAFYFFFSNPVVHKFHSHTANCRSFCVGSNSSTDWLNELTVIMYQQTVYQNILTLVGGLA